MPDKITKFTQACDPTEALEPEDARYVVLDDVRGENFVHAYARSLWRADSTRPEIRLFAGHRGVGKTCELKRLQRLLEEPTGPFAENKSFFVIYIDVDPIALDLNDIDWPDLLIHIAARVVKSLRESGIPGQSGILRYIQAKWDELKATLGAEVTITKAELDVEIASLSLELKNRPSSRKVLREAIERHGTGLQKALNDMLEAANLKLKQQNKAGLVLLLDGLERMPRRAIGDDKVDTHERLFIRRCTQWGNIRANMVMTVPISLLYTTSFREVDQNLGKSTHPVPMIKTHEYESTGPGPAPDHPGMKKLIELVEKRCKFADSAILEVFDSVETVHHLCRQSGGHPRNLLVMICSALNQIDKFPITLDVAERAVRNEANALVREMPDKYWELLKKFEKPTQDCPTDDNHRNMLFLLHVFEYMNGEVWFEINPILRSHPRLQRDPS